MASIGLSSFLSAAAQVTQGLMVGKAMGEQAQAQQQQAEAEKNQEAARQLQAQKNVDSMREIEKQRIADQQKAEADRVTYQGEEEKRRVKGETDRTNDTLLGRYTNGANQSGLASRHYREMAVSAQVMGMAPADRQKYQEYYNGLADQADAEAETWKGKARGLNISGTEGMYDTTSTPAPPPSITGTPPPATDGVSPATATFTPPAPVTPSRLKAPIATQPTVKQTAAEAAAKRADKRLSNAEKAQMNLQDWRAYEKKLFGERLSDAEINARAVQGYRDAQVELGRGHLDVAQQGQRERERSDRYREAHPRGRSGIDQKAAAGREASKLESQLGDEKKLLAMDPDVRASKIRKLHAVYKAAGLTMDPGLQKYLHRNMGAAMTAPGTKGSTSKERTSAMKILTGMHSQGFQQPPAPDYDPATPDGIKARAGAFKRVWERSTPSQREDLKDSVKTKLDYAYYQANQPKQGATAPRRAAGGPPVLPPVTKDTAVPAFPGTEATPRSAHPARATASPARAVGKPLPPEDRAKYTYQGQDFSPKLNVPAPKGIDASLWDKTRAEPNPFKKGSNEWQVWQAFIGRGISSTDILKGLDGKSKPYFSDLITRIKKNHLGLGAQTAAPSTPSPKMTDKEFRRNAVANNETINFSSRVPGEWKGLKFPEGVTNVWGTSGNRGIARIGGKSYWMEVDGEKVVVGAPKGR